MQSRDELHDTPSPQLGMMSVKSRSAPDLLRSNERPVLRSISNLPHVQSGHESAKPIFNKPLVKSIPSKKSNRHLKRQTIKLHPFDNVIIPSKSPETPLAKFLIKKSRKLPNSPLSINHIQCSNLPITGDCHANYTNELLNKSKNGNFNVLLLGTLTASFLEDISDIIQIKQLDLSTSFKTKYCFDDLPTLPSYLPSVSTMNRLFSLVCSKPSITDHLTTLNLSGIDLTIEQISKLNGLKQLEHLDLSNCNISDVHLMCFDENQFSLLRNLYLNGNLLITDSSFESLSKLPNLSLLNLDFTSITTKGLIYYLKKRYPSIHKLQAIKISSNIWLDLYQKISRHYSFSSLFPHIILILDESTIEKIEDRELLLQQLCFHRMLDHETIYSDWMSTCDLKSTLKNKLFTLQLEATLLKLAK